MAEITLFVKRKRGEEEKWESFRVHVEPERATVLEALLKIREEKDPTLSFRYGCRFKSCGLCAVTVNGHPRMACLTRVKDQMRVEALQKIPVLEDLVVDRSFLTETLKKEKLFPEMLDLTLPPIADEAFSQLSKCTDCQCCLAGCAEYDYEKREEFAGPLFFVKLAQLQFHPLNRADYREKAKKMGIERLRDVEQIPCPYGIPIKKLAVDPFLNQRK